MSVKTRKRNRARKRALLVQKKKHQKKQDSLRHLSKDFFVFPEESEPGLHIDSRYKSEELKEVLYQLSFYFYALQESPAARVKSDPNIVPHNTKRISDQVLLDLSSTRITFELLSNKLYLKVSEINREIREGQSEVERALIYEKLFLFLLKNYNVSDLLPEDRIEDLKKLAKI